TAVTRFGMGCFRSDGGETSGGVGAATSAKMRITLQNSGEPFGGESLVTMDNSKAIGRMVNESLIELTCEIGFIGNITLQCPNGVNHTRWCDGGQRKIDLQCYDVIYDVPSCSLSNGLGAWSGNSCTIVTSNPDNITCECDVMDSVANGGSSQQGDEGRRNLIVAARKEKEFGSTSNVDVAGIMGSATKSFIATWEVAATLDAQTLAKNSFVFFVMGGVLVGTLFLCVYGVIKDKKEFKQFTAKLEEESSRMSAFSDADRKKEMLTASEATFSKNVHSKWSLAKAQIASRHKYLSVFFKFSSSKTRPQRIALLVSSFLTVLFIEAILFRYSYPDPPPGCAFLDDMESCELPKNYWNTTANRCLWTVETQSCSFIQPTLTFVNTVILSILAVFVSVPVVTILALIFNNMIFPHVSFSWGSAGEDIEVDPEARERGGSEATKVMKRDVVKENIKELTNSSVITGAIKAARNRRKVKRLARSTLKEVYERVDEKMRSLQEEEKDIWSRIIEGAMDREKAELESTLKEVKGAQDRIKDHFYQTSIWKRIWGSDSRSKILKKLRVDIKLSLAIEDALEDVESIRNKNLKLLEFARISTLTKFEQQIYLKNSIEFEDDELESIHIVKKIFGYLLITCYVLATSFYICLFGISNGTQMTKTWLVSFLVADAQDIFLFTPLKIYILFVYLPSLISKNVSRTREGLVKIKHWYGKMVNENASVIVALNHPELEASSLVLEAFNHVGSKDELTLPNPVSVPATPGVKAKQRSIWHPGGSMLEAVSADTRGRSRSEAASDVLVVEVDESRFKYTGLRRIGVCIFGWYGLLPDLIQDMLMEFLAPLAVGIFIYSQMLVYRQWSTDNSQPLLIEAGATGGFLVWYLARKVYRTRKRRMKAAKRNDNDIKEIANPMSVEQGLEMQNFQSQLAIRKAGGGASTVLGGGDNMHILGASVEDLRNPTGGKGTSGAGKLEEKSHVHRAASFKNKNLKLGPGKKLRKNSKTRAASGAGGPAAGPAGSEGGGISVKQTGQAGADKKKEEVREQEKNKLQGDKGPGEGGDKEQMNSESEGKGEGTTGLQNVKTLEKQAPAETAGSNIAAKGVDTSGKKKRAETEKTEETKEKKKVEIPMTPLQRQAAAAKAWSKPEEDAKKSASKKPAAKMNNNAEEVAEARSGKELWKQAKKRIKWVKAFSEKYKQEYYINQETKEAVWIKPDDFDGE
ncbi:hypothetical protein TrLO_g15644, partial [Triparma laevis f. longispina]